MSRFGVSEGISAPLLSPAQGAGFSISEYAEDAAHDLVNRVFCSNDLPDAGKELSEKMHKVCGPTLDYADDSQPEARCFFRLGEALAKSCSKIAAKKWAYAGYGNNIPNNLEGELFRAADGSIKEAVGLKSRGDQSFLDNNPCEVLRLVSAAIDETDSLQGILDGLPNADTRRKFFRQYLAANLGGTSWEVGMDFLPASSTPITNGNNGDGKVINAAPPSSSGGGIVAIAAAAAAAYFLTKG